MLVLVPGAGYPKLHYVNTLLENNMLKQISLCASLLFVAMGTPAQTMYRCGNAYSDTPCGPDVKVLNAPKPKPANDDDYLKKLKSDIADTERSLIQRRDELAFVKATQPLPTNPADPEKTAKMQEDCRIWITNVRDWKDRDSLKISAPKRGTAEYRWVHKKAVIAWPYYALVNAKNSYGGYVGERPMACYADMAETTILMAE